MILCSNFMCYNLMTLTNIWKLTMFKQTNDLEKQGKI